MRTNLLWWHCGGTGLSPRLLYSQHEERLGSISVSKALFLTFQLEDWRSNAKRPHTGRSNSAPVGRQEAETGETPETHGLASLSYMMANNKRPCLIQGQ